MKAAPYWDIYNTQLACLNYGRATWEADPKANGEDHAVQVGDVGYMRNGGFHRLFNILQEKDHAWNQSLGVPDDFKPLKSMGKIIFARSPLKAGALHSHTVRHISAHSHISSPTGSPVTPSGEFSFSCSRERGAALILFDQAYRNDVLITELFEEYFLANYESWLTFAHRLKRGVSLDDIILVTGRDVTSDWAMAVFSQGETKGKADLGADTSLGFSATFGMEFGWKTEGIVHSHSGPLPVEPPSPHSKGKARAPVSRQNKDWDQCVFLRGYCLRRRNFLAPRHLKAAAGPSDVGPGDRDPRDMLMTLSGESVHSNSADYNHLSPIFDYILDNSDVEIALAHDDDLHAFIQDTSEPDEVRKAIKAISPKIIILGSIGKIDGRSVTSPSKHIIGVEPLTAPESVNVQPETNKAPPSQAGRILDTAAPRTRDYSDDEGGDNPINDSYEFRKDVIKKKIRAIGRMTRILVILREESERVSEIKSMHDGRLPPGLLVLGPEVLRNIPLSELLTPSSPSGSMAWIESWLGDSGLHEDNSWLPVPSRPRGVSQSSEMSQVPPPYSPPLPPDESRPVVTSREDSRESLQSPTPSSLLGISRNESGGRWQSVKAKISVIGRLQRSLVKIREASAGRLRWSSTPSVISNGVSSAGTSVS